MENLNVLHFERNRYWSGKPLTSADFSAEQTYIGNKRRFINKYTLGGGVMCGLSVYNLDNISIMIESGVAIDGSGREIVVPNSVMKKLSAIDGFSELENGQSTLYIKYSEENIAPVFSPNVNSSGDGYVPGRVKEEFSLYLMQGKPAEIVYDMGELINSAFLYEDSDYAVSVEFPSKTSLSAKTKLSVKITKLTDNVSDFSYETILQTPAFTSETGEKELPIKLYDLCLNQGESLEYDYWIIPTTLADDTVLIAMQGKTTVMKNGENKTPETNFVLKTAVLDLDIEEILDGEIAKQSLEMRDFGIPSDVAIATFDLYISQNAYSIEAVEGYTNNRMVLPSDEHRRRAMRKYFETESVIQNIKQATTADFSENILNSKNSQHGITTGVLEIPLSTNVRKGDIFYSDEIIHGLGEGDVHVSVGVEYASVDKRTGAHERCVIYGDSELFSNDLPEITYAQTAVKLYNSRGTFVAAAKITKETSYVVLVLRWVAMRLNAPDDNLRIANVTGKSIVANTPTVVLGTKDSHYFGVQFKNMDPVTLTYELTDANSGEITIDGIYTAPNKQGVYEIRISCTEMPLISTYAYAIVKNKDLF